MAKAAPDATIDGGILETVQTATLMTACNAQPTTRAEAVTTFALADVAPTFTGPANGDTSGRKITVDAKTGVTVDTGGTATHIALVDGTNLLYVTTCNSLLLVASSTVDFPAWDIEVGDPT